MPAPRPTPPPDPAGFSALRRPERDPDGVLVVVLAGDLDLDAVPTLVRVVSDALAEGDVVLDLATLDFVALAGLDALATLLAEARELRRHLRAVRCPRTVARTAGLAARLGVVVDLDGLAPVPEP